MRKNLRQSILKSLGRYIAITLIIAIGSALFMGLRMTKTDMVATGEFFTGETNMFDLRFISTYGWTDEEVTQARVLDGVADAEGVFYQDVIARAEGDEEDSVLRFYNLPEEINLVSLRGGRMPQHPWECLADGFYTDDSILGKRIHLSQANDDEVYENMVYDSYLVVGYVATPLYMDPNRGTTTVGTGSVDIYCYIPRDGLSVDYYTQIDLTLTADYPMYSDAYRSHLEAMTETMEPHAERLGQQRFDALKQEAEEEYQEGYQEYLDGLKEYEEGAEEFEQELADALKELEDAEEEINSGAAQVRRGQFQLELAKRELLANRTLLDNQEKELDSQEAQAIAGLQSARAGVKQLEDAVAYARSQMSPLTPETVPAAIATLDAQIALIESGAAPDALAAQYEALKAYRRSLQSGLSTYNGLVAKLNEAKTMVATLEKAVNEDIPAGRAAIAQGRKEIEAGLKTVEDQSAKLYAANKRLEEAREELEQGWIDYEEGKAEGEQELADAWEELEEGRLELLDAREEIDSMEPVEVFVLDRTTNVGYNSLNSSSDIVAGVSRVLPVFFLLVASLVCITTMTRMIDEERTQIGTLKALGYSNFAIMYKYLFYAGSGAVIGCCIGIAIGSTLLPMILWKAYSTMLHIQPNLVLTVDKPLSIGVVVMYTAVMLFVTWYSLRKTLREEPAELIRPKAPDPGKKILLELLPFWKYISFLNKVTIRNIFRYRQRLAMMLVGIGGCTALLVTGFGIRDSISGIVDKQYQNITPYHMEVYFDGDLSPEDRESFLKELGQDAEATIFYHQSKVDLRYGGSAQEIQLISAGDELTEFIRMENEEGAVSLPDAGQAVLSIGAAKMLGISEGDTISLRDADMRSIEVTVSGIYRNHIYNYCIISPETFENSFGEAAEIQRAMIRAGEGVDHYLLAARLMELDGVANVSVCLDTMEIVNKMLNALDLVIVVIVFSAGLLAVTVLYNLTNININERIREIATIKVLGFNGRETSAYVFKENMTLTVAGSLIGLFLGKILLDFVLSQINLDLMWFMTIVERPSYILSFMLTIVSALVVNFIFYFKLETINMAEALKSVE